MVVYSDRANNKLKNDINGSNNGEKLDFMKACLVKEVSGNWLRLFDVKDTDLEFGWIHAKYLLLSKYSLKDDTKIPVPKKAIILTSIEELKSDTTVLQQVLEKRKFYSQPKANKTYIRGEPKSFQIFFIYKEEKNAVLLGVNDVLSGNFITNQSSIKGWIPKANITPWNTRVCLEPSRDSDAFDVYGKEKLRGYPSVRELEGCLENENCNENTAFVEFSVGKIPNNRMRKPILKNVDENIKYIVSIAKSQLDCEDCDTDDINKDMLEQLKRKQQNTNIIFVIDATKSMEPYYPKVAESITKIIDNNESLNQHNLKFGLITYKDYCDKPPFNITKLDTDSEKIITAIRNQNVSSSPCDGDLPEAQYNALINGIKQFDLDPKESNVMILIGDCGNHPSDSEKNKYNVSEVTEVLYNNNLNIISYQVNVCDNRGSL